MQTFMPYSQFIEVAKCLDNKRLGKQRVEVWVIYQTLEKMKIAKGICPKCKQLFDKKYSECICGYTGTYLKKIPWSNHPIVKMWNGYESALLRYGLFICDEWKRRGFVDKMKNKFIEELGKRALQLGPGDFLKGEPEWIKNTSLMASHRSNLLRKNYNHYKQFGWNVPNDLPYVWIKKTE